MLCATRSSAAGRRFMLGIRRSGVRVRANRARDSVREGVSPVLRGKELRMRQAIFWAATLALGCFSTIASAQDASPDTAKQEPAKQEPAKLDPADAYDSIGVARMVPVTEEHPERRAG